MKTLTIILAVATLVMFTNCASKSKEECSTCPIKRVLTGASKPDAEKKS